MDPGPGANQALNPALAFGADGVRFRFDRLEGVIFMPAILALIRIGRHDSRIRKRATRGKQFCSTRQV